jgi:hypothetical protein
MVSNPKRKAIGSSNRNLHRRTGCLGLFSGRAACVAKERIDSGRHLILEICFFSTCGATIGRNQPGENKSERGKWISGKEESDVLACI